jgi:two-component system chemotaxis response regulator CheB
MSGKLHVLVVDDSPVARSLLTEILNAEPDIEVIGTACHGVEAVEKVALLHPDVVTMDVQMPRMDGYAATREIMTTCPTPIVVVSGVGGSTDAEKSMLSLDAGALAVIGKPSSPSSPDFEQSARNFVNTVQSMAAVSVIRRHRPRQTAEVTPGQTRHCELVVGSKPRLITIAASTGGPQALRIVLGGIPADFPIPIVIVQHISPGFTEGLAAWLHGATAVKVKVAEDGEALRPGYIYIAPETVHCGVRAEEKLELIRRPPVSGFCPSATILFESASRAFGKSHIAVVLTGMGKDGCEGLRSVHQTGGVIIAQNEATSVVYGMPKAPIDEGIADLILPLAAIGPTLVQLVNTPGGRSTSGGSRQT